jgi:hypothetical protein
MTVAELNGPVDVVAWSRISRTDIRYWQPRTLGECLFNYWD